MRDRPTRRRFALAAVLALVGWAPPARADYEFLLTDAAGMAATNFTVVQGDAVDIRVYLLETNTTTLVDTGLSSAGVQLGGFASGIAAVQTAPVRGGAWDDGTGTAGNPAALRVFQDIGGPVTAPATGPEANRVLIGTFRFTGVSIGTTAFVTADPGAGADTVLADGLVLDGMINNTAGLITVTAIPEPGALALAGLAAAPLLARLRRRRR